MLRLVVSCFNRYFAFKPKGGYHRCHTVLTSQQIDTLIRYNKDAELFCSVELYDSEGAVIGCPLSFDVDADGNLPFALITAREVVKRLRQHGLTYDVWFSGSKGFHIVTHSMIKGSDCHLICKAIKRTYFNLPEVDEHIYRERSLFRIQGSINNKTGLYKIPVTLDEGLRNTLKIAEDRPKIDYSSDIRTDKCSLVNGASLILEEIRYKHDVDATEGYIVVPCIDKMWADTSPPRSEWHSIIYTLVKHFMNLGIESHKIAELFDEHPFWGILSDDGYSTRSYSKVITSMSRSRKTALGCKHGLSSNCMQYYCSKLCRFNDELSVNDLIWN